MESQYLESQYGSMKIVSKIPMHSAASWQKFAYGMKNASCICLVSNFFEGTYLYFNHQLVMLVELQKVVIFAILMPKGFEWDQLESPTRQGPFWLHKAARLWSEIWP